jgi:hypothetical protein
LENRELIEAIETLRKRPLLSMFLSDEVLINDDCVLPLYHQLEKLGPVPKLDLFLYSRGGTTETPWKIISLLREYTTNLGVIIPYRAHSAATHITIGADEIIMGPLSEISPVDPTRMHPLLPRDAQGESIPISVQDLHHCLKFVRREIKGGDEHQKLVEVYEKLFEYVNPLALGAIEQSYQLSRLISKKVLETHFDPERDQEKIKYIIDKLSGYYQSHAYTIGRKEAKEDLGLSVTYPDTPLWEAIWNLYTYYREEVQATSQDEQKKIGYRHIAFIETKNRRILLQHRLDLTQGVNDVQWIDGQ